MRLNRHIHALVPLAIAAALIAPGCGGDDDGDTASTGSTAAAATQPALTKEQAAFVAKADAICAAGDAQIDKGGQAFAGTTGKVDQLVNTVIVPGTRAEVQKLRALTPPEGDEQQVTDFLDALDAGLDQLEAHPDQLAGGEAFDMLLAARKLAFAYGFTDCAR